MILPTITEPSSPALMAIWRAGQESALRTISTPVFWSSLWVRPFLIASVASNRRAPPPGEGPFSPRGGGGGLGLPRRVLPPLALARGPPAAAVSRHATGEFGEPLLQLLAIIVGGGLLDLGLDLSDAAFDLGLLAGA